jgi:succinyl-CoA synthetase beta subunit
MRVNGEGARRIFARALGAEPPFAPSGSPPLARLAIRIDPVAGAPRFHLRAGEAVIAVSVDVTRGLAAGEAREALRGAGLAGDEAAALARRAAEAWDVFARAEALSLDATIGARTGGGVGFRDCALVLDPRALAREIWLEECLEGGATLELELWKAGIDYVPLGGDLGLLCIGAGMTLAMLDRLRDAGVRPCAFLDVTRNYTVEGLTRALGVLLDRHGARALAVNVFGGITRMDELAANLAEALARRAEVSRAVGARADFNARSGTKRATVGVPVVVRLEGTGGDAGRAALERAGIAVAASSAEVIAFARSLASAPGSGR